MRSSNRQISLRPASSISLARHDLSKLQLKANSVLTTGLSLFLHSGSLILHKLAKLHEVLQLATICAQCKK